MPDLVGMCGAYSRALQQFERPGIASAGARQPIEAWHDFGVVIEHVRTGVEHRLQRFRLALEIRDQHFDPAGRHQRPRPADGLGENRSAAILQIIAIDRCDHDVIQSQRMDGVGDALRLVEIERDRLAMRHGAIAARTRADIAQDHEGGRAVVPALADVGTMRLFANRVQAEAAHQPLQTLVVRRARRAHLEPFRLGGPGLRCGRLRGRLWDQGDDRRHANFQS